MGDFGRAGRGMLTFSCLAVLLAALYFLLAVTPAARTSAEKASSSQNASGAAAAPVNRFVYGKSGLGQELFCTSIAPEGEARARLLLTYEVHGFEDAYPHDGEVLVDIGNAIIAYFSGHRAALASCTLYVVPSANPDGLAYGTTAYGKGRCQISLGVDINRDFAYSFTPIGSAREHTLSAPFAAPESRALRSLVQTVKPGAVIDTHGWYNEFIGSAALAGPFRQGLGMQSAPWSDFSPQLQHGFFSAWASTQHAQAMLLELPPRLDRDPAGAAAGIEKAVTLLAAQLSK